MITTADIGKELIRKYGKPGTPIKLESIEQNGYLVCRRRSGIKTTITRPEFYKVREGK